MNPTLEPIAESNAASATNDRRLRHQSDADARGSVLEHNLQSYFPELAKFRSAKELEASALYARLRPEIEAVLSVAAQENFAPLTDKDSAQSTSIRAIAWNLERGIQFEGIAKTLREHSGLNDGDIYLLTELDYGMARTENRFIARELAEKLRLNYAFATSYINLAKGNGWDSRVSDADNTFGLHGNAILSRYPLKNAHAFALPNGKDKMRGTEKRIGSQRVVIADVEHPRGTFRTACVHLDAHSTQLHRHRQMQLLIDHLESLTPCLPTLIGGDWNTSTYNSKRAVYAIAGFARRCAMGVSHVINNHYLDPGNWFERHLFRGLEARGYDYKTLNAYRTGTLHYDVKDFAANTNMRDWVPNWCFWFIKRALEPHNGLCSLQLDWFTGKGITVDKQRPPSVVGDLHSDEDKPLSDHDAITLNFILQEKRILEAGEFW